MGFTFGPLTDKSLEAYLIESEKGHDTFVLSKKSTRIYYVLGGSGYFTIDAKRYDVSPGMLVEVPPKAEYSYSGKMTMLGVSKPRCRNGRDTLTRWNPDVVPLSTPFKAERESWLSRAARITILGKSPVRAFLRLNERVWMKLPRWLRRSAPIVSYGTLLHALARASGNRGQAFSTLFLRNRPELRLIANLLNERPKGDSLKVTVLGCSTGAEAYSVAWTIRSARPDLQLVMNAVDISRPAVELAKRGVYSFTTPELTGTFVFERMTAAEQQQFFDRRGDEIAVKTWLKNGITWRVDDAAEDEIVDELGPQDMVIANNFLCHMSDPEAERCLRNLSRLVSPGGYLFVSGIDLDVRTKVAADLGWEPIEDLLAEIHEGDPPMRDFWPFHYGGLEPLNRSRRDWKIRYAAAFHSTAKPAVTAANNEKDARDRWSRPNSITPTTV